MKQFIHPLIAIGILFIFTVNSTLSAQGCYFYISAEIKDVTCSTYGQITVNLADTTGKGLNEYRYSLFSPSVTITEQASNTFSGLPAGTYKVVVDALCNGSPVSSDTLRNQIVRSLTAAPAVSITGPDKLCIGEKTTLSPAIGGTWVSNQLLVATVTGDGVVTALSAGSASFTFTDANNSCSATTTDITVYCAITLVVQDIQAAPGMPVDLGTAIVSSSVSDLVYYYDNRALNQVSSPGAMPAITKSTTFYVKSKSDLCNNELKEFVVLVNNSPYITNNLPLCETSTNRLIGIPVGGTWKSLDNSVATVDNVGLVTAVAEGVTEIKYFTAGNTDSASVMVNVGLQPYIDVQNITVCAGSVVNLNTAINNVHGNALFYADAACSILVGNPVSGITSDTTFYVKAKNSSNCTSPVVPVNIQVKPMPAITLINGPANQRVCEASPIVDVKYSLDNVNGVTVSGLPQGVSFNVNSDILTISGTPVIAGVYDYEIIATRGDGLCSAIATGSITVNPNPRAAFSYIVDQIDPKMVRFTDNSATVSGSTINKWTWNYGDNSGGSSQQGHIYIFDFFGDYNVSLTVTDDKGCSHQSSQIVHTNHMIWPNFTINNAEQCLAGNQFKFRDYNIILGASTDTLYSWNFGDGTITSPSKNDREQTYQYNKPGMCGYLLCRNKRN